MNSFFELNTVCNGTPPPPPLSLTFVTLKESSIIRKSRDTINTTTFAWADDGRQFSFIGAQLYLEKNWFDEELNVKVELSKVER